MIRRHSVLASILALAVILAASAPAFADNSGKFKLRYAAVLQDTHLDPGDYAIRWTNANSATTVTVLKKNNVVATSQAKLVDRGAKSDRNAVIYNEGGDGTRTIQEIRFAGSSQVIVFNN
jgi:hypothetical protein